MLPVANTPIEAARSRGPAKTTSIPSMVLEVDPEKIDAGVVLWLTSKRRQDPGAGATVDYKQSWGLCL